MKNNAKVTTLIQKGVIFDIMILGLKGQNAVHACKINKFWRTYPAFDPDIR